MRVSELRALRNSGSEIVKKIAQEFQADYSKIEKLLLPHKLKDIDEMGAREIKKLKEEYRTLFDKGERLDSMKDSTFISRLKDKVIAKG
jgi:predicted DNA-binding protein (UPF0278 family)